MTQVLPGNAVAAMPNDRDKGKTIVIGGGFGGHTTTEWLSFLLFWGINIWIIYRGMDLVRHVENWAAPFVLVMTGALLWWAIGKAGGLGPLLSHPGKFRTFSDFWPVFVPSLTAMIGFWATLSLNMPDFTRFGKSQREQAIGQAVALPTTWKVLLALLPRVVTAAMQTTMISSISVKPGLDRRHLRDPEPGTGTLTVAAPKRRSALGTPRGR